MGMDVYGNNPKCEAGEYFRNNCWGWRPLWNYCHRIASDLISDELFQSGHCNDGAGLGSIASKKLGKMLRDEITSGRCATYQREYEAEVKEIPRDTCEQCNGSGDRPGWVTYKLADGTIVDPWSDYNSEEVDDIGSKKKITVTSLTGLSVHINEREPEQIEGAERIFSDPNAKSCNGCNGCKGEGTRESSAAWYPFTVANVKEFAEFLENCGGFKIL